MDPVTGAVVIAGLKYAGPSGAEVVKNFLNRVLSPAGDAAGVALAQPIEEWNRKRVERAQDVVSSAAKLLETSGFEPRPVPGRILMPLLERCSVEDDEVLRGMWVNLLASAAVDSTRRVLPSFPSILSELSPKAAAALDWAYRNGRIPLIEAYGPDSVRGLEQSLEGLTAIVALRVPDMEAAIGLKSGEGGLLLADLTRMGLLKETDQRDPDQREADRKYGGMPPPPNILATMPPMTLHFTITVLGEALVESCSVPPTASP